MRRAFRSRPLAAAAFVALVAACAAGTLFVAGPTPFFQAQSLPSAEASYDVIVVGTDPEGIAAAVSAARNGLWTLLVDGRGRDVLGGLFTLGWLNSLDINYAPRGSEAPILNGGIFLEWYEKVEGTSFDVGTATRAFEALVAAEPRLDVALGAQSLEPILESAGNPGSRAVRGVILIAPDGSRRAVFARAVIDATQDADFAAACGVPYTIGREDLGEKEGDIPVTLVFRLRNVTARVWHDIGEAVKAQDQGRRTYGSDARSVWGYVAMQDYAPANVGRVAMRGLNIGRQGNNTALVSGLHIFGTDPLDPASREEALRIGQDEIPRVVGYLKAHFPEFAPVELDGIAPELYVRESRHIRGEYRLTILDVLENRDHSDRVALGSYPVDIQRRGLSDAGAIFCSPVMYAVPFRCLVPLEVDGLLVVGRGASFDSLPHGSARVVPLGMATGQAAGAAAALAVQEGVTLRELSRSQELITRLQDNLTRQGMSLHPFAVEPQPFMEHKAYPGLKAAVSMGLWVGGYDNDFRLDQPSNPTRLVIHMWCVARVHPAAFSSDLAKAYEGLEETQKTGPLTLQQAVYTILLSGGVVGPRSDALTVAREMGLLRPETLCLIDDPDRLSNGDVFLLVRDAVERVAGATYDEDSHSPGRP